jgi:cytochrome c oxidase subunit 2
MMFADLPLFPEQASTMAERVDALLFFLLGVTGFFMVLIPVLVIYFAVKYRRRVEGERPPRILGSLRLELFWTIVPAILAAIIFVWGADVYYSIARPPDDCIEIYVVAKQWMWKVQHPGGKREMNQLHVPVGRPVKVILTSEDVIHSFFVPAFRIHQDVVPGRYYQAWFEATRVDPNGYHLFCSQYCGTDHSGMIGRVYVMEEKDYVNWLNSKAEGSLALEGRKLFLKLQCVTCHSRETQRAPLLEDLYRSRVLLDDGRTVTADEGYIRESILRPRFKVVAGWKPIMPTFEGQVSEEDLIKLIAFVKALGPGQTPVRNEAAPQPAVEPGPESAKPSTGPESPGGSKPKP